MTGNSPTEPRREAGAPNRASDASVRAELLERYGSAEAVLESAGRDLAHGVDRLAEETGIGPERLLPVLVTLALESRPRGLTGERGRGADRQPRALGGFDVVLLLGALGVLLLIVRAVLLTL